MDLSACGNGDSGREQALKKDNHEDKGQKPPPQLTPPQHLSSASLFLEAFALQVSPVAAFLAFFFPCRCRCRCFRVASKGTEKKGGGKAEKKRKRRAGNIVAALVLSRLTSFSCLPSFSSSFSTTAARTHTRAPATVRTAALPLVWGRRRCHRHHHRRYLYRFCV